MDEKDDKYYPDTSNFYFIDKYDSKIAVYNANGAFGLVFIVKKEKKENNEFAINIDNE